ncbi:MAG: cytochrome c oxidase subunit II [Oligoflexus sp.]
MKRKGIFLLTLLSSCMSDNRQSMIHTASQVADDIAYLWWLMLIVYTAVFLVVITLLAFGIKTKTRSEVPGGSRLWLLIGGIALPFVTVLVMLILSLQVTKAIPTDKADLVVEVVGRNWWWEVRYPEYGIVSANEIYLPQGANVRFDLSAREVIHSFWLPALQGKMDMIPDHSTQLFLKTREIGKFRGICAEFCGLQHARMAFHVVVLEEQDFAEWLAARQSDASVQKAMQLAGHEVYFKKGCDTCHRIRGSEAQGDVGPDLTHIGSRLSLGAGTLPYSQENLAAFVHDPQTFKPGNAMPATVIDDDAMQDLVEFLDTLK